MPAIGALALAIAVGSLHSWAARFYHLDELYRDVAGGAERRRIMKLVWHAPSAIWVVTAAAVLVARIDAQSSLYLTGVALFSYLVSGVGNLIAHRRLFIGGVMLIAVAALVYADHAFNAAGA
ncbi:MAG: hypothetical protein AAF291_00360 [Pseudomonadota bacterium]